MPTKVGTKKCGTCSCMRLENRNVGYCLKLDTARGLLKHGCDKHTPFMVVQCACGCGQETDINPLTKKPSQFVLGHNSRCDVAKEAHARTHNGSSWHKGIKHSEESRNQMSISHKKAWERKGDHYYSDEGRERLAESTRKNKTGIKLSEDTKQLIGERSKERWEQIKADPEKYDNIKILFSKTAKKRFTTMTDDERIRWNFLHKFRCTSQVNGTTIRHDSGWERSFYHLLKSFNIIFDYVNTQDTKIILTNNHPWFPDFILKEYKIILDVKGYFRAKNKFHTKILPYIPDKVKQDFSILTYEKNPIGKKYLTFEDILRDCIVH